MLTIPVTFDPGLLKTIMDVAPWLLTVVLFLIVWSRIMQPELKAARDSNERALNISTENTRLVVESAGAIKAAAAEMHTAANANVQAAQINHATAEVMKATTDRLYTMMDQQWQRSLAARNAAGDG